MWMPEKEAPKNTKQRKTTVQKRNAPEEIVLNLVHRLVISKSCKRHKKLWHVFEVCHTTIKKDGLPGMDINCCARTVYANEEIFFLLKYSNPPKLSINSLVIT